MDVASIRDELTLLEDLMRRFEQILRRRHRLSTLTTGPTPSTSSTISRSAMATSASSSARLGERGLSSLGRCEPHVLATVAERPRRARREATRVGADHAELRGGPSRPRPQHGRPLRSPPPGAGAPGHGDPPERGRRRLPRWCGIWSPRAWTWPASTAPMTTRTAGSRWPSTCARRPPRSSAPAGCRWTCPGPSYAPGPLAEGPQVVKLRPERDLRGVPVAPALATLVAAPRPDADPALPVDRSWIDRRHAGGRGRHGRHAGLTTASCGWSRRRRPRLVVEVWDTTYVETGADALLRRRHDHGGRPGAGPPVPRAAGRGSPGADPRPGAGRAVASRRAGTGPDRLHPCRGLRGSQGRPAGDPRRREDHRRRSRASPPTSSGSGS